MVLNYFVLRTIVGTVYKLCFLTACDESYKFMRDIDQLRPTVTFKLQNSGKALNLFFFNYLYYLLLKLYCMPSSLGRFVGRGRQLVDLQHLFFLLCLCGGLIRRAGDFLLFSRCPSLPAFLANVTLYNDPLHQYGYFACTYR